MTNTQIAEKLGWKRECPLNDGETYVWVGPRRLDVEDAPPDFSRDLQAVIDEVERREMAITLRRVWNVSPWGKYIWDASIENGKRHASPAPAEALLAALLDAVEEG